MSASRRRLLACGAAALLLPACSLDADRDHRGADAPAAAPLPQPPRVAWVFGSGGPRGFVHVGVVKALAELGLRPDAVVGSSVGALLGTLYAAGLPVGEIERMALNLEPWQLLRWSPGAGPADWSGAAIAGLVNRRLDGRPLQALPLPSVCVAQRLRDGAVVGFSRGDAGLAVQAACAIDGRLEPVTIRGEAYADADLRMPLPVRVARALGAARVLAVDASAHEDEAPPEAAAYRAADLRKRALTAPDSALADVLLHPDTGYWAGSSRDYRERVIAIGHRSTLARAEGLRALHARASADRL